MKFSSIFLFIAGAIVGSHHNDSSCSSGPDSPHHHGGGSSSKNHHLDGGGGSTANGRAQYISASCVVFTHYSGDTATEVDEHFSRALNFSNKESKGEFLIIECVVFIIVFFF